MDDRVLMYDQTLIEQRTDVSLTLTNAPQKQPPLYKLTYHRGILEEVSSTITTVLGPHPFSTTQN